MPFLYQDLNRRINWLLVLYLDSTDLLPHCPSFTLTQQYCPVYIQSYSDNRHPVMIIGECLDILTPRVTSFGLVKVWPSIAYAVYLCIRLLICQMSTVNLNTKIGYQYWQFSFLPTLSLFYIYEFICSLHEFCGAFLATNGEAFSFKIGLNHITKFEKLQILLQAKIRLSNIRSDNAACLCLTRLNRTAWKLWF